MNFSIWWMADPNLKIDPKMLKIKTKHDEFKYLEQRTEKPDCGNKIKSLEKDYENYKKKFKKSNEKKSFY